MSRINFSNLPLTSDQARGARNYFGWAQAKAAEESALPLHKLKRFEAGNYIPDDDFLNALRAFFEKRGYRFEDTPVPGASARDTGLVFPAGVVGEPAENAGSIAGNRPKLTAVHHMRIALADEGEMGHILDLIEENEAKAQELMSLPVETGFFGGLSDAAGVKHAQAIRLLSENGVLFARLFGRDIGGAPSADALKAGKKPDTHAELLHRTHGDAHRAAAGDRDAKARHRAHDSAESVFQAIGLA